MDPVKIRNDKIGLKIVDNLKKKHFEAYYFSDRDEAVKKILELIPLNHSVAWGGSKTMEQLGIKQLLKEKGYKLIDRDEAESAEEKNARMHEALNCGTYIMSSNAITQEGELYNIDGNANRVAALCYGPESVLIIAGMNKIVKNLDEAYLKVRNYTAPVNCQRFDVDTPCVKTGMCYDCNSINSICAQFVTTRFCRPEGRIKVVLINENLGF